MKKRIYTAFCTGLVAVFLLTACSGQVIQNEITASRPDNTGSLTEATVPTEGLSSTEAAANPATPTVVIIPTEAEEKVTETPVPTMEPIVVDDYDITASVTGLSLKDACSGYFKIGVGLNGSGLSNSTLRSEAMSEIIKYHFNSVTYSNLMKPSYLLNQEGSAYNIVNGNPEPAVSFQTVIEGLEFCKENGIGMRGHTLVWHTQVPDWFFREDYTNSGAYVDRDTMLMRMESYIRQVLEFTQENYPGVVYCWDVVNEAVEISSGAYETESGFQIRTSYDSGKKTNLWYQTIGTDYVEKAFEYARKYAAPEVKLFYNDYNTFQPAKTKAICRLVTALQEKDLIDGIGMQGYMSLSYPAMIGSTESVAAALQEFGKLGLEIQLTELTISSEDKAEASMEKQAKRYESLFSILKLYDTDNGGSVNITSVTVFGLMDEYLFYSNNKEYSRLFDGQLQPKPAFYSILSTMTE